MNEARLNEYPSQYDAQRQQLNAQWQGYTVTPAKPNVPTAWPVPAVRLSDEDVERIAAAVVRALRAAEAP